jgi:thioredoxin 1
MIKELAEGQLAGIVQSTSDKLIVVEFYGLDCSACKAAKPWWESLPSKYPSVAFYTIQCGACQDDVEAYRITAIPTFLFFLNTRQVDRVRGFERPKLTAALDKYKSMADPFSGQGHTLHRPPPSLPVDTYTRDILLEMGFPPRKVEQALTATRNGAVDECVLHLERLQKSTPAADDIRQTLIDMGIDALLVDAAIARVASPSIDRCLDAIKDMQARAEPKPPEPSGPPPARSDGSPLPRAADGTCVLQLEFEDKSRLAGTFQAGDTLQAVRDFVVAKLPAAAKNDIAFEIVVPRQLLDSSRFGETLAELKLLPRAKLNVKFL